MKRVLAIGLGLLTAASSPGWAVTLNDRLVEAVRSADHAAVKSLLAQHVNPNKALPDKSTVLAWAVDRQDDETVRMLLAAGAKPNAVDVLGATPLTLACELGSSDIANRLLAAHANVNTLRPDGVGPLSLCARYAAPDVVAKMLVSGADVKAVDSQGQTPLMFAAAGGKTENLAILIKHGADVNAASHGGFTPLFFAIKSGGLETMNALLDAGANINFKAPYGTEALNLALYDKNFALATILVERGADVNNWDESGQQPLHVAVANGNLAFAKFLLSKGADVNGLTKAAYRVASHQLVDVDQLANGGAALNIVTPGGSDGDWKPKFVYAPYLGSTRAPASPPPPSPPLELAAKAGSVEIMKLLVDAGVKPAAKFTDGSNVTFAAVEGGKLDAVKYALQVNPDLNVTGPGGATVMHVALTARTTKLSADVIQYLADQGAKLDAKNARGQTPADLITRGAPPEIQTLYANILKAHGIGVKTDGQVAQQ